MHLITAHLKPVIDAAAFIVGPSPVSRLIELLAVRHVAFGLTRIPGRCLREDDVSDALDSIGRVVWGCARGNGHKG